MANETETADIGSESTKTAKESAARADDTKQRIADMRADRADINEAHRRRIEPQPYVLVSDNENGEGDARRVDVDGSVTSPPEGVRFATPEQINKYNQDRLDEDEADIDGVDVKPTSFRP